jgi:N6-adenosine-specific RNA methylase IME4
LKERGVEQHDSKRWQRVADLPERTFEAALKEPEVSTASLVRAANERQREKTRARRRKDIRRHSGPLPAGPFRVIYADPPWDYGNKGLTEYGHAESHYPTMPLVDICALPVRQIIDEEAVLFLWATSPMLQHAFIIIEEWGFIYKTSFVWDKVKHNFGHYNSVRHELLLVATRGSCTPDNKKLFDSVQSIERTKHSEKPDAFRGIIETLYTKGKKIELFARSKHRGWTGWGFEA